ncbi:hypothetical protein FFF34_000925 [Inquilinus sp. KBS0705]|nr:hypothetical protein FFF34_000925 [Inquilinus sp. KBS0705]
MIFNESLQIAISNLGWIDKGTLWVYNGVEQQHSSIKISDAKHLTLTEGIDGYFSIVHHYEDSKIAISVHHFKKPKKEYCKIYFDNFKTSFTGDISFSQFIPKYYICAFALADDREFHLIKIKANMICLEDEKIEWFKNGAFDFGYQGLTSVTEFSNELIFTVQRDSFLYRYSLNDGKIIAKVTLAGKRGNPEPVIINNSIWVADYDTLIRLENWEVKQAIKLQDEAEGCSQFIGKFSFNAENDWCIVARPFSGDVIGLNKYFKIDYQCKTGSQPIEAVLLKNGLVIARDWQTGMLVKGK